MTDLQQRKALLVEEKQIKELLATIRKGQISGVGVGPSRAEIRRLYRQLEAAWKRWNRLIMLLDPTAADLPAATLKGGAIKALVASRSFGNRTTPPRTGLGTKFGATIYAP